MSRAPFVVIFRPTHVPVPSTNPWDIDGVTSPPRFCADEALAVARQIAGPEPDGVEVKAAAVAPRVEGHFAPHALRITATDSPEGNAWMRRLAGVE